MCGKRGHSIDYCRRQPASGAFVDIRIFSSPKALSVAEVRQVPMQSVCADWRGGPLASSFDWAFVLDPKTLWFCARVPGRPDFERSHLPGEFVEGLWERDVAEFFIQDSSGRYQEFNVSPSGAWWTVLLMSYRTRAEATLEPRLAAVDTGISDGGWSAVLGVARDDLSVALEEGSRLHVSGIVHKPVKQYLSSKPVPSIDPDFHYPDCFQPTEFVPL